MMGVKKVCVIGGGSAGIVAVKECLTENLDVVCFEKASSLGGLWRYHEDDISDVASVMRSTIINSSKEMSAFSDFPPPDNFPNYMHNTMMVRYFELYANKHNVHPHIKYNHEVINVTRVDDYETTGRWKVKVRNMALKQVFEDIFDGVMICTGHHTKPLVPTFPGQEKFKGKVMHSHSYKKPVSVEDKNVVVVGVGNSGGDAAVELSTVAKKVYLSTRRGVWVVNRVGPRGIPMDIDFVSRFYTIILSLLPHNLRNNIMESKLNARFDHEAYNLKPKHRAFEQHIMINDALPNRILSGTVVVKGDIKEFTGNGIIFEGETEETPCDLVVLATGYLFSFPFVGEDVIKVEKNQTDLYKYMFPPHLAQPHTLACIGLIQPLGAIFPIAEMQSRWFTQLLQGKRKLPAVEVMVNDIRRTRQQLKELFFEGERHTIEVIWVDYMDMIAAEVGAKPNLWKYFFTDFGLWRHLVFGPCVPYQFRLDGPHSWPGAREAIVGTMARVQAPLNTKRTFKKV